MLTDRNIAIITYIVQNLRIADLHKVFKVMYFADQKHLVQYGFKFTEDKYFALPKGPVPTSIYDSLKAIRSGKPNAFLDVRGMVINAKQIADLEELSESMLNALNESIAENGENSFTENTDKSHKLAWHSSYSEMDDILIAVEGGATPEIQQLVQLYKQTDTLYS